jgi:hypothetical protein
MDLMEEYSKELLIVIIGFFILCYLLFIDYIHDAFDFIYSGNNDFSELDLPKGCQCNLNFFRFMCDLNNIKKWVNNYKLFKYEYAEENYGSTKYYDGAFNPWPYDINKKMEIPVTSRIAKIAIPYDKIKKDVDDYYAVKKRDYDCIGSFIEIIIKIQNDMIENCELDPVMHMDNYEFREILRYENNCIIISRVYFFVTGEKVIIEYNFEQDIDDEDKKAIRDHFMKAHKKFAEYIFLLKIIKNIQDEMIRKNILDLELKMDNKKIINEMLFWDGNLQEITKRLSNKDMEYQLNEEDIGKICNFLVRGQNRLNKVKMANKVNDLVRDMSSKILCEKTKERI